MPLKTLILISTLLVSCENNTSLHSPIDSLNGMSSEDFKNNLRDSLEKDINKRILLDTIGISQAAIRVTSARLVKREYSNYRDIKVAYKNVSNKKVTAIKFRWYGLDAFGEPADVGGTFARGFGGGFDDDPLSPGKSTSSQWSILSQDAKKIVLAWPIQIMFADGTKWEVK